MPDPSLSGGCLCGGVRFELTEPAQAAGYCHCTRCQRRTGTAASAQARIDGRTFRLLRGSELVKAEGEVDWRCVNAECPARLREELLHFAARGVMNIDGLGDVMVAQLLAAGYVKGIADLYELKKEQLLVLHRCGHQPGSAATTIMCRSGTRRWS